MKHCIKQILAAVLVLALFCGFSSVASAEDDRHTFTYWIGAVEDASYYGSYDNNPAVMYLETLPFVGDTGKEETIDFTFVVPGIANATDNCSLLLATESYTDIMHISYYSGSVAELYEEGIALDLTPYVEQYMPNYLAILEANPDLAKTATTVIDGEKKYLQLYNYKLRLPDQWEGLMYRRDWVVKYGANPVTGEAFSGAYTIFNEDGTPNTDSWEDNVVFPSGETYPKYISDWEWMFEIFTVALQDQNITDGYCVSISYPGYCETGEWVSSFGGGGPHWYINGDNVEFGMTSDNFRAYLQCMNTWYKNGWVDKAFAEHSGDIFYQIDDTKVRQGKVGAWIGMIGGMMNRLDIDTPLTDDIMAFAAPYPINDVYGPESARNVAPYTMFQIGRVDFATIITTKAKDKDLVALFKLLDYNYTDESGIIHAYGLNAEQIAASGSDAYSKYGVDSAYTVTDQVGEDGRIICHLHPVLAADSGNLGNALKANHTIGVCESNIYNIINPLETPQYSQLVDLWGMYTNTGRFTDPFMGQFNADDSATITKINLNVRTYGAKNVPKFITGKSDPFNDKDWNTFVKAVNKYRVDKATEIYQAMLDSLK